MLIGDDAAIVVEEGAASASRIVGNYVHNTTGRDDGHYCLNCADADALIAGNVFRGGTTGLLRGSRTLRGNVLLAARSLASETVLSSHTHQLVAELPAGALVEGNLFIGPAHSLLAPQPAPQRAATRADRPRTIIRNNVFDGFEGPTRAIQLSAQGPVDAPIAVHGNLFLRVGSLVYDEAGSGRLLAFCDFNAMSPPPRRAFDRAQVQSVRAGDLGWSSRDVSAASVERLGLEGPLPARIDEFDDAVLSGKLTVSALIDHRAAPYRLRADSSLRGAGYAQPGGSASPPSDIGLSAK